MVGAGVVSPRKGGGSDTSRPCKSSAAAAAGPSSSTGDANVKQYFPSLVTLMQPEPLAATNGKESKKRRLVQQHQQPPSTAREPTGPWLLEPPAEVHDWHRLAVCFK